MPESIKNIVKLFSKEVRNVLGEDFKKMIVYGSYARGDYMENSDVDIMVLTSLTNKDIQPVEYKFFDFFMEYGVDISVIVKNEEHFKYWLGALPFYDNVEKEGVVIDG